MLTILYEWKNSLTLFKKDTLLLLLYSWYKLTVQVYKDLFRYFWWLIVPFVVFLIYSQIHGDDARVSTPVCGILFIIIQYVIILLARPTLEKKDRRYVMNKGLAYIFSIMITLFLYKLSTVLSAVLITVSSIPFVALNGQFYVGWFLSLLAFFTGTLLFLWILILLFLLDSKGSVRDCFKALWHGYKMALYNAPISIALAGLLTMGYYALALLDTYFSPQFQGVLYVFVFPIAITLIATVYIKRVHDQCSLYFGRRGT